MSVILIVRMKSQMHKWFRSEIKGEASPDSQRYNNLPESIGS